MSSKIPGYYRDQNIAQTWAMIVNMDGYSFAKAMELTAIGYLQELLKAHSSNLNTLEYGIVINSTAATFPTHFSIAGPYGS